MNKSILLGILFIFIGCNGEDKAKYNHKVGEFEMIGQAIDDAQGDNSSTSSIKELWVDYCNVSKEIVVLSIKLKDKERYKHWQFTRTITCDTAMSL